MINRPTRGDLTGFILASVLAVLLVAVMIFLVPTVNCSECAGKGLVHYSRIVHLDFVGYEDNRCGQCRGLGKVPFLKRCTGDLER